MSIVKFKKCPEPTKSCKSNSYASKGRPKKDNSVKGDIFLNCRCCGVLMRPDWYSKLDPRYCADCLQ